MEQRLTRLRSAGVHSRPIEAAETLVTLVSILGLHDSRTRGHSERVRALTDLLSTELDLPEEDRIRLRWAALVHDLGKLTVPAEVLNGGRDLTDDQWAGLRRHPRRECGWSPACCPGSATGAAPSASTTSAGTAPATPRAWPATTSATPRASSPSPTPSRR
jgi:hypothetical protein